MSAPRLRLAEVERFERRVRLRIPFRFGVITVTEATQAVLRARIEVEGGGSSWGVAAECLGAKWFDKDPRFTDAQNLDQLRQALDLAVGLYRDAGLATPFGLWARTYRAQLRRGAELGLVPLVASYGPALLDRAVLDALGLARGAGFAEMMRADLAGIAAEVAGLVPELAGFAMGRFLASLEPRQAVELRHTVGLLDPLAGPDRTGPPVADGLPETLEEVVLRQRGRWYKLKVCGRIDEDIDRLSRIAAVLDALPGYRVTLDGNEQFDDVGGFAALWARMGEVPALARLCASTAFAEQPVRRAVALQRPVGALGDALPMIIDESDGDLEAFPAALALGYRGVSTKNCKGFYKSLVNAARIARLRDAEPGREVFMSAEDLTTWPGASLQQDLALVGLLGIAHVERNAQHFIDGMSFAPAAEQRRFAAAHPGLYDMGSGTARLRAPGGTIDLRSLDCPGFAVGAEHDFAAMEPMPPAPGERIAPASPG